MLPARRLALTRPRTRSLVSSSPRLTYLADEYEDRSEIMDDFPVDNHQPGGHKGGRPRGPRKTEPDSALSRTMSYILRHGAAQSGVPMRQDGYVRVSDLLKTPKLQSLNFQRLEQIVKEDKKNRYSLVYDNQLGQAENTWWIRANQGHTIKDIQVDMVDIVDAAQVPMAVHGTMYRNWREIQSEGLSRMKRHHVHFAQGLVGTGVVSGMRQACQVLIYLDIPLALASGLKLLLSANGVVLCAGDEAGFIAPRFFLEVFDAKRGRPFEGWERGRERKDLPPAALPPPNTEQNEPEKL